MIYDLRFQRRNVTAASGRVTQLSALPQMELKAIANSSIEKP
jgi:hypothetical protein